MYIILLKHSLDNLRTDQMKSENIIYLTFVLDELLFYFSFSLVCYRLILLKDKSYSYVKKKTKHKPFMDKHWCTAHILSNCCTIYGQKIESN